MFLEPADLQLHFIYYARACIASSEGTPLDGPQGLPPFPSWKLEGNLWKVSGGVWKSFRTLLETSRSFPELRQKFAVAKHNGSATTKF